MGWISTERVIDAAREHGGCVTDMAAALGVSRQAVYGRISRNAIVRIEVNRQRREALRVCMFPTCDTKVTYEDDPTKRSISRKFCDEHRDKAYMNLIRRVKYHERKV